MAYTVNKTDSSASPNQYTVNDSVVNTQTDLSFIGKGYAGYGELIAENFLHLLENFSNTSQPSKPVKGQLWYDSTAGRIKVYTGASFSGVGATVPYQSAQPTAIATGDLWVDSDTGQLYYYNGTQSILVGPPSSTGTTSGFTFDSIFDSSDNSQNITKLFNDGNLIAIISEDTFTPKSSLSGFSTITKGITLSTAISDLKFKGTATDADALGGAAASTFLKSTENDTTSGTLGVVNDSGFTVGADSDFKISIDSSGVIVQNVIQDTDITFKVNDAGTTTTVMTIDGAESRVGIGTTTPTEKLEVNGTIKASGITTSVTGNVSGNLASTGANTMGSLTMSGTITSQSIVPAANTTYDIGTSALAYNNVFATATSAKYADLAEVYATDNNYEVGTVVVFGGSKEITITDQKYDRRVAGVISDKPAYLMNDGADGQPVALLGKVKCKVHGTIKKGMTLVASDRTGCAVKSEHPPSGSIVGKALEDYNSDEIGVINIVVGRC